jgi:bifunctional non-homologous end joining protein LigD
MLATAGRLPSRDDAWGFEFKWDGVRTIAYVEGGRTRLVSRNDRDVTISYPELRRAGEVLGSRDAILDGEIVAFDSRGRPSFGMLQQRMHVTDVARARQLADRVPVVLLVFDVLFLEGRSTIERPYSDRRGLLDSLRLQGPHLNAPPWFKGGGGDVFQAAIRQDLEGVVAKRMGSTYQPGRRSPDWIKVKHVRTQEVVLGGWTSGQGRRSSSMGALLLGIPGPGGLEYVGRVGTGFTEDTLADLTARLRKLERPTSRFATPIPARQAVGARWVEPRLVGEVSFSEWTNEGRLRHPVWRGLRADKSVSDVRREPWPEST